MKNQRAYLIGGIFVFMALFPQGFLFAKTPPVKNFDHPKLVETRELFTLMDHPFIRIVDIRTSLSDYLKGHIPGAVYIHFENLQAPDKGIPDQPPDRIFLERLLGDSLVLSNSMGVIIYSEKSNPNATLLAWTLDFLGHKKVAVLNGGWEKWISERFPVHRSYPSLSSNKFFGKVVPDAAAEKKWIKDRLSAKNVLILDARPSRQYSGEEGEGVRRGHIPGAKNIYWEATLEGEEVKVWKKKEELEKFFSESGVTRDKQIVVYGETGREASHLYFTLKHVLGFPHVSLYRGSWVEWSADKTLPVKMGLEP